MHTHSRWNLPRLDIGVLVVLCVAWAALWLSSSVIVDSARDLWAALDLVQEGHVPLQGPEIGGRWQLGPWWFLLLALPLSLGFNATFTALFVGALASLKFPIAYALGQRLGGRSFALLFVCMLAVPSFAWWEPLVASHTVLVIPTSLLMLLFAEHARRHPSSGSFLAGGLIFGLALHAHPSTVVLLPAWLPATQQAMSTGNWQRPLLFLVAPLLLLAPSLLVEAGSGWQQLGSTRDYLVQSGVAERLLRAPALAYQMPSAPFSIPAAMTVDPGWVTVWVWPAAWALILAFAVAGLVILGLRQRKRATEVAALFALALLGSACIREVTPFYQTFVLVPPFALLLAAGLHSLAVAARLERIVALLASISAVVLVAWLLALRMAALGLGEQRLPSAALADVVHGIRAQDTPVELFPVRLLDRLGRQGCRAGPLRVHGDAAVMLETAGDLARAMHCPDQSSWVLGGTDRSQAALLGLSRGLLRRAGLADARSGSYLWTSDVTAFHPIGGQALLRPAAYPPHPIPGEDRTTVEIAFDLPGGSVVGVSNWIALFNPLLDVEVEVNGIRVQPLANSFSTRLFRCETCEGPARWNVSFSAARSDWVEVYGFEAERLNTLAE